MKMRSEKKRQIISIAIVLIYAILAGVYYYLVHRGHWPDHEQMASIYDFHIRELLGINGIGIKKSFSSLTGFLAYTLFGTTMKGVLFEASIRYFLIILPISFMMLYDFEKKKINWSIIPLVTFLLVIVNMRPSEYNGHYYLWYHQCFYDQHTGAVFWTVWAVFAIELMMQAKNKIKKYVYKICLGFIILFGLLSRDLIFCVVFIGPAGIFLLVTLWKKDRQWFWRLAIAVLFLLVVARALKPFSTVLQIMFPSYSYAGSNSSSHYGYTGNAPVLPIYGNVGFINIEDIWRQVTNVVTEILSLYNVEYVNQPILAFTSVVIVIRAGLVFYMLLLSVRQIILFLRADGERMKETDYTLVISSLAVVINILAVVMTMWGSGYNCGRYLTTVFFLGTLILVKNIKKRIEYMVPNDPKISHFFVFVAFSLCVLLDMPLFWRVYDYGQPYKQWQRDAARVIMENDLGNGLSGSCCCTTMTILMGGKYTVYPVYEENGEIMGYPVYEENGKITTWNEINTPINYVITGTNAPEGYSWYNPFTEEEICNSFGEPDRIYDTGVFVIYYYDEPLENS